MYPIHIHRYLKIEKFNLRDKTNIIGSNGQLISRQTNGDDFVSKGHYFLLFLQI